MLMMLIARTINSELVKAVAYTTSRTFFVILKPSIGPVIVVFPGRTVPKRGGEGEGFRNGCFGTFLAILNVFDPGVTVNNNLFISYSIIPTLPSIPPLISPTP